MARFYTDTGRVIEASMTSMVGRWVRMRRSTQNGYCHIPEGKVMRIVSTDRTGLELRGRLCACCGITSVIRGVESTSVILFEVPEDAKRKPVAPLPKYVPEVKITTAAQRWGEQQGVEEEDDDGD